MKKKILSLGIALAMLITLLPCSAFANEDEGAKQATRLASIYVAITEPKAYQLPSYNFTFDKTTQQALDTSMENVVRWYVYDEGNLEPPYENYRLMESNEYFEPGEIYRASVDFYITDDYYFWGRDCHAYINKTGCSYSTSDKYITLSRDFYVAYESSKMTQRLVANITEPVAGQHPSFDLTMDIKPSAAKHPGSTPVLKWFRCIGESETEDGDIDWSQWKELSAGDTFIDGDLYMASVEFRLKENYDADTYKGTEISINNENCGIEGYNNSYKLTNEYYAHDLGEYKLTQKATFIYSGVFEAECALCGETVCRYIPGAKTPVLSTSTYTFNNSKKTPSVTVRNDSGKILSKSVKYADGRTSVGKYSVKVTLTEPNYYGSKTVYFVINPPTKSISSLSRSKKALTVKWSKPSSTYRKQITGYEIRYSTSSKMSNAKTVKVKGASETSKKLSKLSAKKKYYVQLRTYKTVGSKTYRSSWSNAKSATTK